MKAVFSHWATGRDYLADESAKLVFAGNSENMGVVASRYKPEGGVLIRHMFCEPDEIRRAFSRMVNDSKTAFREEFAIPGEPGWFRSPVCDPETGETVGEF